LNYWFDDNCEERKLDSTNQMMVQCTSQDKLQIVTFKATDTSVPVPNYISNCKKLLGGSGQQCTLTYYGAGEGPKFFVNDAVNGS